MESGSDYRSICAFANDFDDLGGGYLVVGVDAPDGKPILPPVGVDENDIDHIQREMVGLNNLINPAYFPRVSVEDIDGKKIIVIWVPGGQNRPYEVPDDINAKTKNYNYYIRWMGNSIRANKQQKEELIYLSNKVPFDDRPNTQSNIDDISFTLLKEHLRQTNSRLLEWTEAHSKSEVLRQMELLYGPAELQYPKNVALMLFSDNPERFFPYTRVEIVHFPNGASNTVVSSHCCSEGKDQKSKRGGGSHKDVELPL